MPCPMCYKVVGFWKNERVPEELAEFHVTVLFKNGKKG
jgi:hypothetical protein